MKENLIHCPQCGQQANSDEIRFCAKCGFDLKGVKELLAPETNKLKNERNKARINAFRQGAGLVIFGFMLTCVLYILSQLNVLPGSYSKIAFMSFLTLGLARMCLPLIFGEIRPTEKSAEISPVDAANQNQLPKNHDSKSLPEAEYRPPIIRGGKIYETNELVTPLSVTEVTTRQLKNKLEQE